MTRRWVLLVGALLVATIALGVSGVALAAPDARCTLATLDGLYVFASTGFTIPASGPAEPKAIVEFIRFNGDGTLGVPGATLSLNGVIAQIPPGGTGSYTVADLVPADGACTGSLTFTGGPSFDLFIRAKGADIWMIQTNPANVLQGTATKVSR
jgi:hypothetical protein